MKPTSRSVKLDKSPVKIEKTRRKIMDAALKVFSEKGYHVSNVDEIVEKSGTSKGGFYFHFPSKKALFLTLVDEMLKILFAKIENAVNEKSDIADQIETALSKALHIFTKYRSLAKFLLVEAVGSGSQFEKIRFESYSRFACLIQGLLDQAIKEKRIEPMDTETVSWIWVGAIYQVIIRWLYLRNDVSLKKDIETLKSILLKSVGIKNLTLVQNCSRINNLRRNKNGS